MLLPQGLFYYPDDRPGIRRRRNGRGFSYLAPDGTRIERGPERDRLEAMAVPPAYERVWMSPLANGHLLATGYDTRERKQYRYHPDWVAARSETKFACLAAFGRALPAIRLQVRRDLAAEAGDRELALAAAVTLIDRLSLRVGHRDYAQTNGSYGALTLRARHVRLQNGLIRLDFVAKGGKRIRRQLGDRTLLRVLEKARHLSGAELLTWTDAEGAAHSLASGTLNQYIAEAAGPGPDDEHFTAKTFRTWAGTLAAFERACAGPASKESLAEAAAARLYNTPAVARTSYVHPRVMELAGTTPDLPEPIRLPRLGSAEARLLAFLEA